MVVNLLVFTIASCYVIFKYLYDELYYSLQAITCGAWQGVCSLDGPSFWVRQCHLPDSSSFWVGQCRLPDRPLSWVGQCHLPDSSSSVRDAVVPGRKWRIYVPVDALHL